MLNAFIYLSALSIFLGAFTLNDLDKEIEKKTPEKLLAPAPACFFPRKEKVSPFIAVSFLVWQAKEYGLEYGAKSFISPRSNESRLDAKIFIPDFAWKPGFKINLGFHVPYDGWDLNFRWTFYEGGFTNIKKNIDSMIFPNGVGVVPLWFYYFFDSNPSTHPRYEAANGTWKLYFNSIESEVGRNFSIHKSLNLRAFFGPIGVWIRQFFRVEYARGNIITPDPNFQLLSSNIIFKSNAWGIGPRLGLDTRWYLLWGFSLIGQGAISTLFTDFNVRRDQNDETIDLNTNTPTSFEANLEDRFTKITPMVQITMGFDWSRCIGHKPHYLKLMMAYEMQYWWEQNQIRRFVNNLYVGQTLSSSGDLQMHGLKLTGSWDF